MADFSNSASITQELVHAYLNLNTLQENATPCRDLKLTRQSNFQQS